MLRRAIAAYASRLEEQARHHARFASVLRAIAHRLRQILEDHPLQTMFTEYGAMGEDGTIRPIVTLNGDHQGKKLYSRKVTGWEEVK